MKPIDVTKEFKDLGPMPAVRRSSTYREIRGRIGLYKGVKVLVKFCGKKGMAHQLAYDELKPLFGLRRMGCFPVEWKSRLALMIVYHENKNILTQVKDALDDDDTMNELVGILLYCLVTGPNDKRQSNILVLKSGHLMAIDEASGFNFMRKDWWYLWSSAAQKRVKRWIRKNGCEDWLERIETIKRSEVVAVLERYGLSKHVGILMRRAKNVRELVEECLFGEST